MERPCKKRKPVLTEEARCVIHDLPGDLLRLILLHLESPLWLVRAACASKRWRSVVDGGDGGCAFLRLARSLHPPVIVGHYQNYAGGGYGFVPSSPSPIGLSLDFFPRKIDFYPQKNAGKSLVHRHHWHVADCHGGLVLLSNEFRIMSDLDLVVCDPLSHRYRNIHHPPDEGSCQKFRYNYKRPRVFLLDDGNISISNFRVLYYCSTFSNVTNVYVFSSADGGDWRFVRHSTADEDFGDLFGSYIGDVIGRIDGSLYMASLDGSVRMLDNAMLEFSELDLPIHVRNSGLEYNYSTFAVVHGASPEATASPATVLMVHVHGDYLELFRRITGSGRWVLEHSIPRLSEATHGLQGYPERSRWRAVDIIAGGTRFAVLKVTLSCGNRSWLLSLDVDTMQLQVVPDDAAYRPFEMKPIIYTLPWPQFLTALAS